ncbi:hypothetical protein [Prevotella sp.]|jgi:hypothetical protein|uniref:hypothetical protein n=2 Tax=Prevotella sp. TaxID=59823 RepID=UPI00307C6A40
MNKGINKSRIVACMLAAGFLAVGSGCTDSDFDLSNIDQTIGIGGDGLQLPTNSTENIVLDDLLDLNNSDFISIAENGDYMFSKQSDDVKPSHPSIDEVLVKEAKVNNNFKIEIPESSLMQTRRKSAGHTKLSKTASVEGEASEFKYRGNVPYEIRDLISAKTASDINIDVNVTAELKKVIPTFKTMTVTIPSYLKLNIGKCSPSQPEYDAEKGIITFHNISSSAKINIKANISSLDFSTPPPTVVFTPGVLGADGSIDFDGAVLLGITFDEVNKEGNSLQNLYMSAKMTMGAIRVTEATGKFKPNLDLEDLGNVNINNVPDFLTDYDVTVNLYNPVIELTATSDIDVAGVATATLIAEDERGNEMAKVEIRGLNIKPNGTTRLCICKHKEGIDETKYDQVKVVSNLSDIVKKIPHRINCKAEVDADTYRKGTVKLGKKYTIDADVHMSAPLAFDEGAQIVYTDTIDGWNEDIDKFSFAEGAYIEMTTEVENKMPAYLNVSAFAIDVNGKEIPQHRIRVDVSNSVKASEDGEKAVVTPVTIKLRENEKGALKTVDGIVFRVTAAAGEKDAQTIVGKTINAYKHTLTARNIKVRLVGKIIADFN